MFVPWKTPLLYSLGYYRLWDRTGKAPIVTNRDHAIILFDGVCNLCSATVRFVADRDPDHQFRFAAIQSEAGHRMMLAYGIPEGELESVVLIERGQAHRKSTAALRIAKRLKGAWPALYVLIVLPRRVRDGLYDFIGKRRYRWFGRTEVCWVPEQPIADLFLDGDENPM